MSKGHSTPWQVIVFVFIESPDTVLSVHLQDCLGRIDFRGGETEAHLLVCHKRTQQSGRRGNPVNLFATQPAAEAARFSIAGLLPAHKTSRLTCTPSSSSRIASQAVKVKEAAGAHTALTSARALQHLVKGPKGTHGPVCDFC